MDFLLTAIAMHRSTPLCIITTIATRCLVMWNLAFSLETVLSSSCPIFTTECHRNLWWLIRIAANSCLIIITAIITSYSFCAQSKWNVNEKTQCARNIVVNLTFQLFHLIKAICAHQLRTLDIDRTPADSFWFFLMPKKSSVIHRTWLLQQILIPNEMAQTGFYELRPFDEQDERKLDEELNRWDATSTVSHLVTNWRLFRLGM